MMMFLVIASLACALTAWLLFTPLAQADVAKREKQKTLCVIVLFVIIFPILFYLLMSR